MYLEIDSNVTELFFGLRKANLSLGKLNLDWVVDSWRMIYQLEHVRGYSTGCLLINPIRSNISPKAVRKLLIECAL